MEKPVNGTALRSAKERFGMSYSNRHADLRIIEITAEQEKPHCHIYMETPVFTPDSSKFVFYRMQHYENGITRMWNGNYMVCDINDHFACRPITDEPGAIGACVSPDGRYMYYMVNEAVPGKGRIMLKRVRLDTYHRETLQVIDQPIHGHQSVPSRIYPLGTISIDGKRYCTSGYLGDGIIENAPWGLMVFDLEKADVNIILEGEDYINMHPQYCKNPDRPNDILVQHNHGSICDREGKMVRLTGGYGADIHVIKDDGTEFRDMPWGRDGIEYCQGHQCWRGAMRTAITSTHTKGLCPLFESLPVDCKDGDHHKGLRIPNGQRNEISRTVTDPRFSHFAFENGGVKFVSDWMAGDTVSQKREQSLVVIGTVSDEPSACLKLTKLLYPKTCWLDQPTHPHPFLSPDATMLFFNSDHGGIPQIWMATGLPYER